MGKIAGVNTALLGGCISSWFEDKGQMGERVPDELNGHMFDLERERLRQVVPCL